MIWGLNKSQNYERMTKTSVAFMGLAIFHLELYSITKFEINNFGFHNSSFSPSLKIFISKLHAGFVHTLIKFLVCKTVRYPCIIYSIIHEGN